MLAPSDKVNKMFLKSDSHVFFVCKMLVLFFLILTGYETLLFIFFLIFDLVSNITCYYNIPKQHTEKGHEIFPQWHSETHNNNTKTIIK